jgi:ribosomal protein L40E
LGVVITVNQATSASPLTQTGSSPLGPLSQTDLLLVGAIVVLIALIAVIMLRRRKPSSLAIGQGTAANLIYCEQCGAQSPSAKQFCEKCGAKLKP